MRTGTDPALRSSTVFDTFIPAGISPNAIPSGGATRRGAACTDNARASADNITT